MQRKTKIIATIGPVSEDEKTLTQLIQAGMDIARFNFSHANYDQYVRVTKFFESYNKQHGTTIQTLIDLQGPRIRVGELPEEGIELHEGEAITFTTDSANKNAIFIDD